MCGKLRFSCKLTLHGLPSFPRTSIFSFWNLSLKFLRAHKLLNAYFFPFLNRRCFLSSGIFAYLNFCVPRKRKYILELLISGLQRLEYRGYDSAGLFSLFRPIFSSIVVLVCPKSIIVPFHCRSCIRRSWKNEVILASGFRISHSDGACASFTKETVVHHSTKFAWEVGLLPALNLSLLVSKVS